MDPTEIPDALSRRKFFEALCYGLGGLCAAILGLPLVGFVVAPLFRKTPESWVNVYIRNPDGFDQVGRVQNFVIDKTVNVTIEDPSPLPWAGITSKSGAWLRRTGENTFIAFSVNCTHLGCPVRWEESAELFMCPCHGGVYYKNGDVAAGPPPKPLFRYEVRVSPNGEVQIKSAAIPITTTV